MLDVSVVVFVSHGSVFLREGEGMAISRDRRYKTSSDDHGSTARS